MHKDYRKPILATVAMALSLGLIFSAVAQPTPYVEIRTYRNAAGQIVGARYISQGCADPQPAGWGSAVGTYTVDRGRCFVIAPPGGGPVN